MAALDVGGWTALWVGGQQYNLSSLALACGTIMCGLGMLHTLAQTPGKLTLIGLPCAKSQCSLIMFIAVLAQSKEEMIFTREEAPFLEEVLIWVTIVQLAYIVCSLSPFCV